MHFIIYFFPIDERRMSTFTMYLLRLLIPTLYTILLLYLTNEQAYIRPIDVVGMHSLLSHELTESLNPLHIQNATRVRCADINRSVSDK